MNKKPQASRKPRHNSRKVPSKKTIQALAVGDAQATVEKEPKSQKRTKWHLFFKDSDNTYINDLAARAKRSSTHGAILQSKATYTAGEDFLFFKNDEPVLKTDLEESFLNYIKSVNADNKSLHWLFLKAAYDYIYSGNTYIEVVKDKNFTSLFYQDASKVRISDDTAYISAYWRDIGNDENPNSSDYPIETIDLWDGNLETKQKRFLVHLKNDVPEYDYYGLPEHVQVLKWADIEYKIAQFNLDMFKNGFFPSVAIDLFGTPPDGMSATEYVNKIKDSFTDEGNNHKMFIQLLDDVSQSAKITEFSSVKEGQFTELQNLATQNIISGHRWFASLSGLLTAGQLGSNQQIRNEYNIALKSVIIPQYQKPLLELFNNLLFIAGFSEHELGVMNVAPVGIEDRIEPKEVLTMNEQRELLGYEPIEEENGINDGNNND